MTATAGRRAALVGLGAVAATEVVLIHLGRTHGSTRAERALALPGDELVADPHVITDHAVTIDAPPAAVWPWLVQVGWHRGGWYTARWVDRLLFPANRASAEAIIPELQHLAIGDLVPDGPPEAECAFVVEQLRPAECLVLRSTSHVPPPWRAHVHIDWSWAFVLRRERGGAATRFHVRSRWRSSPWWFAAAVHLTIVPADLVMSRDMLHGVARRAEGWRAPATAGLR